ALPLAYFQEVRRLKERIESSLKERIESSNSPALLAKAKDAQKILGEQFENFMKNEGQTELNRLKKMIDNLPQGRHSVAVGRRVPGVNLVGNVRRHITSDNETLMNALKAANFNVNEAFSKLLSEKFTIEPAITPELKVVGWSYVLRSDPDKRYAWGVEPKSDVKGVPIIYNDKFTKAPQGYSNLTYDGIIELFVKHGIAGKIDLTGNKSEDFSMRSEFIFSNDLDFGKKVETLANKYYELSVKEYINNLNLENAQAIDKEAYSKMLSTRFHVLINGNNIAFIYEDISNNKDGQTSLLQESALISEVVNAYKDTVIDGYRPSKELRAQMIQYYKEKKDVENVIKHFKNDIVVDAWTQYINSEKLKVMDVIAPISGLFLPYLSNLTNEQLSRMITEKMNNINLKIGDYESLAINLGVELVPGNKAVPQALFSKMAAQNWTGSDLKQLMNMLMAMEDIKNDDGIDFGVSGEAAKQKAQKKYDKIIKEINKRAGNLFKEYIRHSAPSQYGIQKFNSKFENYLMKNFVFNYLSDINAQVAQLYQDNDADITLELLNQIVKKNNDYSKASDSAEWLSEQRKRLLHIRELVNKINNLKDSDFKFFALNKDERLKKSQDPNIKPEEFASLSKAEILKKAQEILDKDEEKVLKRIASGSLNALQTAIKTAIKTAQTAEIQSYKMDSDLYLLRLLANNNYSIQDSLNFIKNQTWSQDVNSIEKMDNFQSSYTDFSQVVINVGLQLSENVSGDYVLSEKIEDAMFKFLAENRQNSSLDTDTAALTQYLLDEFSRDIVIDALNQYTDGKILKFKDVFIPALVSVSSLVPFGYGQVVRTTVSSLQFVSKDFANLTTGNTLKNKMSVIGYMPFDGSKDAMLRTLAASRDKPLRAHKLSDEEGILNWVNKNEETFLLDVLARSVEIELGVSGVKGVEIKFDKNLLPKSEGSKYFEYDAMQDRAKTFADIVNSRQIEMYVQALRALLKADTKNLSVFNAIMKAKKNLEMLKVDASDPKIKKLFDQTDALTKNKAVRKEVIDKKISSVKKGLPAGLTFSEDEILLKLGKNYYDVKKAIASLTGVELPEEIKQSEPVVYDNDKMASFLEGLASDGVDYKYSNKIQNTALLKYFSSLR
ncbi:MAG: hypothetical protein LBQ47_01385, partial [Endomicrobium sp.]|nr:hypothetical protein [Endomicrobium sp.]